jgi:hypothetical protein
MPVFSYTVIEEQSRPFTGHAAGHDVFEGLFWQVLADSGYRRRHTYFIIPFLSGGAPTLSNSEN